MSQNFFAALDDSGDEAPAPVKNNSKKREPQKVTKKAATKGAVEQSKPDNRGRRPNNYDRNTKHGRGGRNPPRDGKRAYDRRSGTGRGKEIKKGGGGARNWGSDKAEAKKMEGKIDEEEVKEDQVVEPVEGQEPAAAEEPASVEEEKPEDKTMTFSEYMASKGKKDDNSERQVDNEFKGVSASKKVEEDFLVMGGGKQKRTKKKKDDQKQVVDVGFRTANPNAGGRGGRGDRDRGGRGGRGGRDGRGRGRGRGGRGSKNQNAGLNVQDEAAFPKL